MEYGDRKELGIRQVIDSSQFFGQGAGTQRDTWQCNNDTNPREEAIPAEGQSWEWGLGSRTNIRECFCGTE